MMPRARASADVTDDDRPAVPFRTEPALSRTRASRCWTTPSSSSGCSAPRVEQLASGLRWAEGPVWFGDGRYLLVSDIPNNRILRWDEADGRVSEFRRPSNHANGHARDRQGRLLSCEHLTRRVTRTEYDGSITVLADGFDGKRLNSPNDIACQRNGAVWFTDPPFGILGLWEGDPAPRELPDAVYRIDPADGSLTQVIADLAAPNGLAFSPDESVLYVVESRAKPHRLIWAYDVGADGTLANKRLYLDAQGAGALDGIAVDADGNVWCGWGQRRLDDRRRRGSRRRARVRPRGQGARAHPAARALRQPVLRRREEQPAVHGELPFAVRVVCECARGDLAARRRCCGKVG